VAKQADISKWKRKLAELPSDASLLMSIEAIVNCGRESGEHNPKRGPYYCCEKSDALLWLFESFMKRNKD
jgi:hypothetical protein